MLLTNFSFTEVDDGPTVVLIAFEVPDNSAKRSWLIVC